MSVVSEIQGVEKKIVKGSEIQTYLLTLDFDY